MYRRRPRNRIQKVAVPLGELRLDVGPHDAPDGTLTTCENVRPTGPPEKPYYAPVVLPRRVENSMGTICAIGQQVLDTTTKLIVVASDKIYLYNPDTPTVAPVTVYTFSATDATRKAQFARVGTRVYIAVSSGADPGEPDITLLLDDTTCKRLYLPDLPTLEITNWADTTEGGLTTVGVYGYRWAYEFKDGTIGPVSQPTFFILTTPTNGWKLTFTLTDYNTSDNPIDDSWWGSEIAAIVIYISDPVGFDSSDTYDLILNAPFYRALTWGAPSEHTVGTETITYSGTNTTLVAGETLDATNLMQHHVEAAATFSYNQQFVLGDVQYDFRKPDALTTFVDSLADRALGTDYAVKLLVTIRTNTGDYSRISEPVYYAVGDATAVDLRGMFGVAWDSAVFYPDRRAVSMSIYTDHNDDGVFELLDLGTSDWATYELTPGDTVAYDWSPTQLDLTNNAGTGATMPDEATTNATRDHDPNRMLVSEPFAPRDLPARLALYVSVSDADPIMGFAANTVPVSEGQYGETPLLVLNRRTVKALVLDSTGGVLFARAVPLAERGSISRYGFTNGEGVVFFASDDGVWTLTPQQSPSPLSAKIHGHESIADILDDLDFDTALAYIDDARGHREVWVGTGARTWAYSLGYGRWFTMNRLRDAFHRIGSSLYGHDTESSEIVEEVRHPNDGIDYDGRGTAVYFELVTRPMTLGADPGQVKRIYRVAIRQRVGTDYLNYAIYSDIGEGELTDDEDLAVTTARTVPAGSRLVAVDTLTVDTGGTIDVYGDVYVVGSTEGALVASGILNADPYDVQGQAQGLCRDIYAVITGKGKMGQGIEAIEFDHEPRLSHRPRKRNF